MENVNTSYIMHSDYIENLPEEHKATFLLYIYNYCVKGEIPDITGFELTVWKFIQNRLDSDLEKFEQTKQARSEAGKKHSGNQYTRKQAEQNKISQTNTENSTKNNTETQENSEQKRLLDGSYNLISEHNKKNNGVKIPIFDKKTFNANEGPKLINKLGSEGVDNILCALKNYLSVAELDNCWKKVFNISNFVKEYHFYRNGYFDLGKYQNKKAPYPTNVHTETPDEQYERICNEIAAENARKNSPSIN